MNGWLVAEIDILCLVICGFIFIKEGRNSSKALWQNRHERLLTSSMLFIVSDMLYLLQLNGNLPQIEQLTYLFNICYYIFLIINCVMWTYIVGEFAGRRFYRKRLSGCLPALPAAAVIILLMTTPFNGLIFTVNVNCEFERGPLNFLVFILCYGYFAVSTLWICMAKPQYNSLAFNHRRIGMLLFPLPLFVCSIIQFFFPILSVTPVGCTVSLILNYELYRQTIASVDSLTQIRNRTSILYYMEDLWQKDPDFGCMMIDIDGFKNVNDTFGHVTGDILLRQFGSALGRTAERFGMTAARYAGDEFLVVCRAEDVKNIALFWDSFEEALEQIVIPGTAISVGASMGFAAMKPMYTSLHELISRCDSEMYLNKNNKKKVRAGQA